MDEGALLLSRHGWLATRPAEFRDALLGILVWREVPVGATFNHGGDAEGGFWGLAAGQLDVASAVSAPDSPPGDIYLPGHWGGIGPLFGQVRAADCVARLPCRIAEVPRARLMALLDAQPGWWEHIGALVAGLTLRYGSAVGDLLIRDPARRLLAVLLRLADCRFSDAPAPVTLAITQEQLAAAANLSRHPAGAVLRRAERAGAIALGYRQLTVIDAARLRAMVDGG